MDDKKLSFLLEKSLMLNDRTIRLNQNLIRNNETLLKIVFGLGLTCLYFIGKQNKKEKK